MNDIQKPTDNAITVIRTGALFTLLGRTGFEYFCDQIAANGFLDEETGGITPLGRAALRAAGVET